MRLAEIFAKEAEFIPLYFSLRDLKPLSEARAAIVEAVLERSLVYLDYRFRRRESGFFKIKLGIYLSSIARSPETSATLPMFPQLEAAKAERVCAVVHHFMG
jgi:hypothetical protein